MQQSARAVSHRALVILTGLLIALVALLFRTQSLNGIERFDEFYHLLAAQGWLDTGAPTILDGQYTRTQLFTGAVKELFRLTGSETVATGRMLAVAAGALLPPVLFFWVRARAGWLAGLVVAALAILWPHGIEEAQTLRFYTWHVLFVTVGALAIFEMVEGRAGWGGLALLAFLAAIYLQITSVIAFAGVLLWLCLAHVLPWMWQHRMRWRLIGGTLVAAAAAGAAAWAAGILEALWAQYRWVPGWGELNQNNVTFYHKLLRDYYPMLWGLFPFAAIFAFVFRPRLASYAAVLFIVILVGQSFGGMKAARYLSYAMPFFFIVWALALAGLALALRGPVLAGLRPLDPTGHGWLAGVAVAVAALFALSVNPFFERSVDTLRGKPFLSWPVIDWYPLRDVVGDWAEAPYRVTTHELHTIAALGDFDALFSAGRLTELPPFTEFVTDPRTGRPVFGQPGSFAAILRCHPEGLFVTETREWDKDLKTALMPVFDASGRRVAIRARDGLLALHWSGAGVSEAACAALPG